jgi:magnesium chelatase subunit D
LSSGASRRLHLACDLLKKEKAKHPQDAYLLVLITDGRANISLGGGAPMMEAKALAGEIRGLGVDALVLDTERFAPCLDLGGLPELSQTLGGQYHNLGDLKADQVLRRIRGLG